MTRKNMTRKQEKAMFASMNKGYRKKRKKTTQKQKRVVSVVSITRKRESQPKNLRAKITTVKEKEKEKTKKKTFSLHLPLPEGASIDPNTGSLITLQKKEEKKKIPGQFRKSFSELNNNEREWSASIDYDENNEIHDIDIRRGKKYSVKTRVDPTDETDVHNHPPTYGLPNSKWINKYERPSGADIASTIWVETNPNYSHKESFIQQSDNRWIRYRVIDKEKARKKYLDAHEQKSTPKKVIDNKYDQLITEYHDQAINRMKPRILNEKGKKRKEELLSQNSTELTFALRTKRKLNKSLTQKEIDTINNKFQPQFTALYKNKTYSQKNPNFFVGKGSYKNVEEREYATTRKTINRKYFQYLENEWGVQVTRMPKGFYGPIILGTK